MGHHTDPSNLPANGIYLFFEHGEKITIGGKTRDRIVRIGTHKSDGRFKGRIRQHYGAKRSLNGNKNSSVFRKHLGGALMRKDNVNDSRLKDWLTQDGPTFVEIEELVSNLLRDKFKFKCFEVAMKEERLELESGIIALLSIHTLGKPSSDWLGFYQIVKR